MKRLSGILAVILVFLFVFSCSQKQNGLTGTYYIGMKLDDAGRVTTTGLEKAFEQVDKNIDFWDQTANHSWKPIKDHGDMYTVIWNGYIEIDKEGAYGFGTISDDGSEVWIDDKLVVDNAELQWYDWEDNISEGDNGGESFPELNLAKGFHKITVKFFDQYESAGIQLFWLKPGEGDSVIPYTGDNFGGTPPTYNKDTNWEVVPSDVLYVSIDKE